LFDGGVISVHVSLEPVKLVHINIFPSVVPAKPKKGEELLTTVTALTLLLLERVLLD
jgi:hypothetical protein